MMLLLFLPATLLPLPSVVAKAHSFLNHTHHPIHRHGYFYLFRHHHHRPSRLYARHNPNPDSNQQKSNQAQLKMNFGGRGFHGGRGGGRGGRGAPHQTETTPLLQNAPQEDISWGEALKTVSPYLIPSTIRLRIVAIVSLLCVFANKVINLLPPYMFKLAVDQLTNNAITGTSIAPIHILILFTITRILQRAISGLQSYTYALVASNNVIRFSVLFFDHLQNLSLEYHLKRKTGEVTRIMDRGVNSIDQLTDTFIFTLIPTLFEAALVTSVFFKLGTPSIALTTFITVILYFAFTFAFTNFRIRLRREVITADNLVSAKATDSIMNYETVKGFGMEVEETREYERLRKDYQSKYVKIRASLSLLNFGQSAIQTIGLGIAVILASYGAATGQLSVGDFVLVNTYVSQLFQPLFFLGSMYRQLTQAITDLESCVRLLKEEITVKDVDDAVDFKFSEEDILERRVGEVCFDNVSFKYSNNERGEASGLKNVSFHVPAGKMIAFVGASGAGKSTLMRLLLRFYDVDSGSVLIDGQDVRKLTQTSLRRQVGVVAQETVLFNSSLRDNISYGKPDATDTEIWEAAKSSALGPFIEKLPEGLDTIVGERGVRLSGGERQRVGVARCIIKNPAIVLLDEASSSLDSNTERELHRNLKQVCRNRTTVMVAHRLSTIMMADEILVFEKNDEGDGMIAERGSHEGLIEQGGLYAGMWQKQTTANQEENTENGFENCEENGGEANGSRI